MSEFWNRVRACKHERLSESYAGNPGCSMAHEGSYASEVHCLDCGAYIANCGCGCINGMSGWPAVRWRRFERESMKHLRAEAEGRKRDE